MNIFALCCAILELVKMCEKNEQKSKGQKRCIQHFIYWNSIYWNYTFQYNITFGWYFRKCKNSMALYYCVLNQQVKNIAAFHRHHCLFLSILKMFRRLSLLLLLFVLQFLSTFRVVMFLIKINCDDYQFIGSSCNYVLIYIYFYFFIQRNRLSW